MAGLFLHSSFSACLVVIYVQSCFGQLAITAPPQNVAGIRGDTSTLVLQCSIDSPDGDPFYQWSEDDVVIYFGPDKDDSHQHSDRYSLETPGSDQWKNYDLEVDTSILGVALKYKCLAARGVTIDRYADVLLLDAQPVCLQDGEATHEYVAGEDAEISCQVTFAGSWPPIMAWSNTGDEINETSGDLAKWVIKLNLTPENNGDEFTCTTSYTAPPNPGPDDATNAPTIGNVQPCSVQLNVLYEPQNTEIEEDTASVGGTLTCNSEANPEVLDQDYEWTIGNDVYVGKTVDLLAIHAGDNNITCCASNVIRGATYKQCAGGLFDVQTGENTDGSDSMSAGAIAGIVIGVLAVAVICLLLFYFLCIRRNKKEDEANATAPASKSNKTVHGDAVRQPVPHANNSFDDDTKPNYLYDDPNRNNDGVVYADLALDNTPRSRNPIQVYEPTTYAEIRHPQPQV